MGNWDEFGICRICEGNGHFVQDGGTIICPECRGKTKHVLKESKSVCPKCGGLKYIKGCCGDSDIPCPFCQG